MDDGIEVEVAGEATGDLREADIEDLRNVFRTGDVKFGEMVLLRKSMDPQLAKVSLGAFRIAIEHADVLLPAVAAYLVGRMGRKVTVTVDGTTITAGSKKEIEALIPLVDQMRRKKGKSK